MSLRIKERFEAWRARPTSDITLFFVLMALFLTMAFMSVTQKMATQDCHILACQYEEQTKTVIGIVGFVLFLPTTLFLYFGWTGAVPVILGLLLSVGYWFLLGFLITNILQKFGVNVPHTNPDKQHKVANMLKFGSYFSFLIMLFAGLIAFFNYPDLKVDVTFDKFLLLATATVAISAFYINYYKGASERDKTIRSSIIRMAHITVLLLVLGSYLTFMAPNSVVLTERTLVDQASLNGFIMGVMTAGFVGLSFILFIAMEGLKGIAASSKENQEGKKSDKRS